MDTVAEVMQSIHTSGLELHPTFYACALGVAPRDAFKRSEKEGLMARFARAQHSGENLGRNLIRCDCPHPLILPLQSSSIHKTAPPPTSLFFC